MATTRLSLTKPPDALAEHWSSCDATSFPCRCNHTRLSHTTEVSLCLSSQNGTQAILWTNSTRAAIAADEPVTKVSATVTLAPPTTRASSTTQDVATLPPALVRQSSSITTGYGAASTPTSPSLPPSSDEPLPVDTSSSSTPMPTSEILPPAPPAENSTSDEPIPTPTPTTTAAPPGTPPTTTAQSDNFYVLFDTGKTSAPPSPAPISSESPEVSADGQSQPPTSSVSTQTTHNDVSTTATPGPVESTVVLDGADGENGGDLSIKTATTASTHMLTVFQTRTVTEMVSAKTIIHSVVITSSSAPPSVQLPSPSAPPSSFCVLPPDQAMESSIGTRPAPSSLQEPSITYTLAPLLTRSIPSVPSNLPTSTENLVQSSISELCSTDPENSTCMALSMISSASTSAESVIATLEITAPTSSPKTLPRPTTTAVPTPVPTPSPTCFGNSGTCYCLTIGTETSCTLRTTFSIGTLSDLRTASSTIATPSPTTTNDTAPVTTTKHSPVPIIPLVIGILGPFLLVLLLIGFFFSWRKVHPTSYSRYASHCPLHQTYYGITAVLQRWKLTRKRNKSLRSGAARAWSGFTQPGSDGYVGLGGHSSSDEKYEAHEMSRPGTAASNYTNIKSNVSDKSHGNAYAAATAATSNATGTSTNNQNKRNLLACSWLSSWSSNQQSRFHELQRRYNAEQANSNADVLRRYELERSRRARDFGVGGLSIDEGRADVEIDTGLSKEKGSGLNGVSGVGTAWTISNGGAPSPGLATGATAAFMSDGLPADLPKSPGISSAKAKSIFTRRSTHKTPKISHPHLDHTTAVSSLPEQAPTTPVAIDGRERRDSWVQRWYDLGSDMPSPRRIGFDNRPNSPNSPSSPISPSSPSSPGAKHRNAMDVPRQTLRQMQEYLQDQAHVRRGHGHKEDVDAITPAPAGVHPAFRNETGYTADSGNERVSGSKSGKWSSSPTSTAVSEKGAWI